MINMDWKAHLKAQIEEGKRIGREKRLKHNEKVRKFFSRKKKEEKKDE